MKRPYWDRGDHPYWLIEPVRCTCGNRPSHRFCDLADLGEAIQAGTFIPSYVLSDWERAEVIAGRKARAQ